MSSQICSRPECGNFLRTGKYYCSTGCAALDRGRKKAENQKLSRDAQRLIPTEVVSLMVGNLGEGAYPVMEEMAITLAEKEVRIPPLMSYKTEAGDAEPHEYGILRTERAEHRPTDLLGYDKIDDMLRNGQVIFGLAMKKAWLQSVFRNDRSWDIDCKDEKVADAVRGIMRYVLQRHGSEFLESMAYGSYFGEKIWDYLPANFWGMDSDEKLYGYRSIRAIHPKSIDKFLYRGRGKHFDGFVQKSSSLTNPRGIRVSVDLALVLTYQKRFRNLWGQPALDPTYPFWFWYEIALRSFLRYLERMGTPVAKCEAPSKGQIKQPDGTSMSTMKYAFLVAGNVAKSNAVAIPSDTDPDTGQKLWSLDYLVDDKRGQQFVQAIEMLGTLILRSLIIADRAIAQGDGETGSYAAAGKHFAVTMLHNEEILSQHVNQMNEYVIPQLVMYNFGARARRAFMVTEGLDPEEKARLFTLLSTMGNQAGQTTMDWIDWKSIFAVENIPVLDKEDYEALQEEKMKKQEETMSMQQKFSTPPPGSNGVGKKAQQATQKVKQSADWVMHNISTGARVPLALTQEQVVDIMDRLEERPFVLDMGSIPLADDELTAAELAEVKEELFSRLGLVDTSDELKDTLWVIILRGLLGDSVENLELSDSDVILLEEHAETVQLGLGDWIKGVVAKAKKLFASVIRKVTGQAKKWEGVVSKAYGKISKRDATGAIITKDGHVWRESDHPRDARGKFAKKRRAGKKPQPGRGAEEKTVEEPKRKQGDVAYHFATTNEDFSAATTEVIGLLADDEYLADTALTDIYVGSFEELKSKYPDVITEDKKGFTGAFMTWDGKLVVYAPDVKPGDDYYAESVEGLKWSIIHEFYHASRAENRQNSIDTLSDDDPLSYPMEEATTELLAAAKYYELYPDKENPSVPASYGGLTKGLIAMARYRHGDNRAGVMADVKVLHGRFPTRSTVMEYVKLTFPDLTAVQLADVRVEIMRTDMSLSTHSGVFDLAAKYHFQNSGLMPGTDEFGEAWEDYWDFWSRDWLFEKGDYGDG